VWGRQTLDVQAGAALFKALGGDGVNVTLAQNDVIGTADFDLVPVVRIKEHLVTELHRSDVWADSFDSCPCESFADLGGCRNQNAAIGTTITFALIYVDQDSVGQHLDRKLVVGVQAVALARSGHRGNVIRPGERSRPP